MRFYLLAVATLLGGVAVSVFAPPRVQSCVGSRCTTSGLPIPGLILVAVAVAIIVVLIKLARRAKMSPTSS